MNSVVLAYDGWSIAKPKFLDTHEMAKNYLDEAISAYLDEHPSSENRQEAFENIPRNIIPMTFAEALNWIMEHKEGDIEV